MHIHFITPDHALWRPATAHVAAVFKVAHGADVTAFAPELVVGADAGGAVICAAGLRAGAGGLFSQVYLDRPIHDALSALSGKDVAAEQVIEVVTMACARPASALALLDAIAAEGRARGMVWGVFTATRSLRAMIDRARMPLLRLAPASRERLEGAESWGRYYDTDPWVCAVLAPADNGRYFDPRRAQAARRGASAPQAAVIAGAAMAAGAGAGA